SCWGSMGSSTQTETLVDRRRRLMRADLARISVDLFAARGYDAVTVNDIAEEAAISTRTFFRYFATKDEVVLEYRRRINARLRRSFEARPPSEGAVTALRQAFLLSSHVEPSDRERAVRFGKIIEGSQALIAQAQGEEMLGAPELVRSVALRMGLDAK